jgi:CBS domain-containing protein
MRIAEAAEALAAAGEQARLVGDPDELKGVVGATQLREAVEAGRGEDLVESLMSGPMTHAHPDHPLSVVVERLAHSEGIIPIVSRTRATTVLGVITVEDIMRGLRGRGRDGGRQQGGGPSVPAASAGGAPGSEEARRPS